jgi:hypothetical protein
VIDSKALLLEAGKLADSEEDPDRAADICNQVLFEEPDNPSALFILGTVFLRAGRHVQAMQLLKRCTELHPKDPRGWKQLSICYTEIGRYDEGLRLAERAVSVRRDADTLANLAYTKATAGDWQGCAQYTREALKLKPDEQAARDLKWNYAQYLLATKQWKEGWDAYRVTLRSKHRKEWQYGDSVEWMGEPDAVLMVTGEQGIGDEVMAASVVPDAAKACKRFIFDCDHRLQALFQRSFPDVLVTGQRRNQTTVLPVMPTHHKSLFGLAELFRNSDGDFSRLPFLVPNPDYLRMFRALLGDGVIGLAWSGGLLRTGVEPRTAGLNAFLPLLRRGGRYLSLQYKDDAAEVAEFERQHGIKVMRVPWVTQCRDMDVVAALIAACDEVVGVHTAALHLSSAMGVPTTTLAHKGSGWRYAPDELVWYPKTTKLHKKRSGESWRDCVSRLVEMRK